MDAVKETRHKVRFAATCREVALLEQQLELCYFHPTELLLARESLLRLTGGRHVRLAARRTLGLLLVHALAGGERDFEELLAEARQHLVFVFVASSACVALCAC